jgi:Ca2+-transporting ATPase
MILWINMVTHGLPGVAFGGEPMDPSLMHRPSPAPTRSVLDRVLVRQIALAGALLACASLGAGLWAERQGHDVQTAVFVTLGLGQLGVALALRSPRGPGWQWRERGLELAVLAAGTLQVAGALVPGLRELLGVEPTSMPELLILIAIGVVPGLLIAGSRRWVDRASLAEAATGSSGPPTLPS